MSVFFLSLFRFQASADGVWKHLIQVIVAAVSKYRKPSNQVAVTGSALPTLRQDVHLVRSAQDAREDPHAALQVPHVRQGVLAAVAAAGPRPHAHRRAPVYVLRVWSSVRRPLKPTRTCADARRRQALPVRLVSTLVLAPLAACSPRTPYDIRLRRRSPWQR